MLNERELSGDIVRLATFYYIRGYREVGVDTLIGRPSEDVVELSFLINEGPPVRVVSLVVEGAEAFEDFDPTADLPIQVGGLLNAMDLAATRDTLIQRFRNRGYPRTDVSRSWLLPARRPYEAEVTFEVETGPHSIFGPITVAGNEQLDEDVIRQLLPFEEGEEYSAVRTLEGQRKPVLHRDGPSARRSSRRWIRRASCPTAWSHSRYGSPRPRFHSMRLGRGMEHFGLLECRMALDEPKLLRGGETAPAPGSGVQLGRR